MAMKFCQNVSNRLIWKVKKNERKKNYRLEVIDDLLLGGGAESDPPPNIR